MRVELIGLDWIGLDQWDDYDMLNLLSQPID